MPLTINRCDLLWEHGDPVVALKRRFGWNNLTSAAADLTHIVYTNYGLHIRAINRLALSAANAIVWLHTDQGQFILKLCADLTRHSDLAQRVAVMVWLNQHGLPVPVIRSGLTGEHQLLADSYSVALHTWVAGTLLEAANHDQVHAAGTALAQLHSTLPKYPALTEIAPLQEPPSLLTLCTNLITWLDGLPADHTYLIDQLSQIGQQWNQRTTASLPQGLTHNDYRAANLICQGSILQAVLDFEEMGWNCWVRDLAWAAVHLGTHFRDWGPISLSARTAFLAAYCAYRPLTSGEAAILPALLTLDSIALARAAHTSQLQTASLAAAYAMARSRPVLRQG